MPLAAVRTIREVAITIINGNNESPFLNVENVIAASYLVPAAFTNVGPTNLARYRVSNDLDDAPPGAYSNPVLPSLVLATPQSQQQSLSTRYAVLPDALKFRSIKFDLTALEVADRVVLFTLTEGYVTWKRLDIGIAAAGTASEPIALAGARGGSFVIGGAFTGTAITFEVGDGGTWTALKTTADAAVSQGIATNRHFPIPTEAFSFPYLRLVSGTAEAAARILRVDLKYVG